MKATFIAPPPEVKRNGFILLGSIALTLALLRLILHNSPNTDLYVGPYNIHHLYTGLLLIALGGIPLAIFTGASLRRDLALAIFGIGLAMALDEWVFLIATDGSNASYLLPVSFWGGVIVVGLACIYAAALVIYAARRGPGRAE